MIDEKKLIEERPEWLNPNCVGEEEYNKGWNACNKYWCNTIKRQPKVGEWIPVSERLPEDQGVYLITSKVLDKTEVQYVFYQKNIEMFICNGIAIAWQPLPEPYKGE